MEMGHAVASVLSHVEDQPVTPVEHPFGLRHRPGGGEQLGHLLGVLGGNGSGVLDVAARHHQYMHRGSRVEVPEGEGPGRLPDLVGWDLTGHDAAEQASGAVVGGHRVPAVIA